VGEATHRSDWLFGEIILRLGIHGIFLRHHAAHREKQDLP
jgi:hypothetical protein